MHADSKLYPNCGKCLVDQPPFFLCRCPLLYTSPLDELIGRFKFQADFACGKVLGDLLASNFVNFYTGNAGNGGTRMPDAIVPVPLYKTRLRQRGFNQAHLLAKSVSRRAAVPLLHNLVIKAKDTQPQSGLTANARARNLTTAFSGNSLPDTDIPKHVAIVDDVITTTSTMRGISACCIDLGVERVDIWAVARTGKL